MIFKNCDELYKECLEYDIFASNGCSGGLSKTWKWLFGKKPIFEDCCDYHDCLYFLGMKDNEGKWEEFKQRLKADNYLFKCIWNQKGVFYKGLACIVWSAVRIGGSRHWVFNEFTYGYGKLKKELESIKK
jgi:hypothetical protein